MLKIVKGFELARRIDAETAERIERRDRAPRCRVLLDAGNAGMNAYGARLRQAAEALGIDLQHEPYAGEPHLVMERLAVLAASPDIDSVITLYPLPQGVLPAEAALSLGEALDVDGLHPDNAGRLALGMTSRPPATAKACRLFAEALAGDLKGQEIVLVGASRIVGRPLANLLLDAEATVTVTHAATRDLAAHTVRADIIITAAGVAGLIGPDHVRDGAIVLDVSINRGPDGLVGDVDLEALGNRSLTVTHVPDGIGPVTTACMMRNIVDAAAQA